MILAEVVTTWTDVAMAAVSIFGVALILWVINR